MLIDRGPLPRQEIQLSEWFYQQQTVDDKLIELEQLNRELDHDYDLGREYKEKAVLFHELYKEMNQEMLELSYKTNYRFELIMDVAHSPPRELHMA